MKKRSKHSHIQEECDTWLTTKGRKKIQYGTTVPRPAPKRSSAMFELLFTQTKSPIQATKQTSIQTFFKKNGSSPGNRSHDEQETGEEVILSEDAAMKKSVTSSTTCEVVPHHTSVEDLDSNSSDLISQSSDAMLMDDMSGWSEEMPNTTNIVSFTDTISVDSASDICHRDQFGVNLDSDRNFSLLLADKQTNVNQSESSLVSDNPGHAAQVATKGYSDLGMTKKNESIEPSVASSSNICDNEESSKKFTKDEKVHKRKVSQSEHTEGVRKDTKLPDVIKEQKSFTTRAKKHIGELTQISRYNDSLDLSLPADENCIGTSLQQPVDNIKQDPCTSLSLTYDSANYSCGKAETDFLHYRNINLPVDTLDLNSSNCSNIYTKERSFQHQLHSKPGKCFKLEEAKQSLISSGNNNDTDSLHLEHEYKSEHRKGFKCKNNQCKSKCTNTFQPNASYRTVDKRKIASEKIREKDAVLSKDSCDTLRLTQIEQDYGKSAKRRKTLKKNRTGNDNFKIASNNISSNGLEQDSLGLSP